MIIVNMNGQLGNQMFQYAVYRKLQLKGKRVKMDLSYYNSHPNHNHFPIFGLPLEVATQKECLIERDEYRTFIDRLRRKIMGRRNNVVSEIGSIEYRYNPNIFTLKRGYIDGYWQSAKYLEGIENVLRREFVFPMPSNTKMQNMTLIERMESGCSVSIHVRRGDYVGGFPVMDMDYYEPAINYFKDKYTNVHFYVFSNDIAWCREHFIGNQFTFVDWNTGQDSYYDMYLMSQCHHNIIGNSSFSWWAAWLNENTQKEIIAPKLWFYTVRTLDIYMDNWIQM